MGRKPKVTEPELINLLDQGHNHKTIAEILGVSRSAVTRAIKRLNAKLPERAKALDPVKFRKNELAIQTAIRAGVAKLIEDAIPQMAWDKISVGEMKKLVDAYHKLWTIDRVEHDQSTENVAIAKKIYHEMSPEDKDYIDKLEKRLYEGEKKEADERYEREKSDGELF